MFRKAPIILFVMGLMAFSFGIGSILVTLRIFPYAVLKDAKQAAEALFAAQNDAPTAQGTYVFASTFKRGGVTRHNPDKSFEGYTLFSAYNGAKCANFLMDMDGEIVQEWYVPASRITPEISESVYEASDEWTCWQGKHLLRDGSLVVNMTGGGFPFEIATIKLDRDSNVVWSLLGQNHHDVHLGADELFYVPAIRFYEKDETGPFRVRDPDGRVYRWRAPIRDDRVIVISSDGEILESFSILQALSGSQYRGLFSAIFRVDLALTHGRDPTHLNNIELITDEWARHYPGIEPGDIMVSLRNASALVIIDRKTKLVKWSLNGPFIRQHDPDLLANGNILLFDNWGARQDTGRSRVIEIDPRNQQIVWQFEGTAEDQLYTRFRGSQQLLANGNILITQAEGGRILEVTRDKEVVWEYINRLETTNGDNEVGIVIGAQRLMADQVSFLSH